MEDITLSFPKIWELFSEFNECCIDKDWITHDDNSLIEAGKEFHKFFWIRNLHAYTFKSILQNTACAISDGVTYKTIQPNYIAWVLPEPPIGNIWLYLIKEAPGLSNKLALYDLSRIYDGEPTCLKVNETKSIVFHEFERFLTNHGVNLFTLTKIRPFSNRQSPIVRKYL